MRLTIRAGQLVRPMETDMDIAPCIKDSGGTRHRRSRSAQRNVFQSRQTEAKTFRLTPHRTESRMSRVRDPEAIARVTS